MDEDLQIGIGLADSLDLLRRDLLMHVAEAFPRNDVLLRHLLGDEIRKVAVGNEKDVLVRQRAHHFGGIGRCADDVGERFDGSSGVDVADDGEIGILCLQLCNSRFQILGRR